MLLLMLMLTLYTLMNCLKSMLILMLMLMLTLYTDNHGMTQMIQKFFSILKRIFKMGIDICLIYILKTKILRETNCYHPLSETFSKVVFFIFRPKYRVN